MRKSSGALLYLGFGAAYWVFMVAYCFYRAGVGKPSDLPCLSAFWGIIGLTSSLAIWPVMAASDVLNGRNAIVLPVWVTVKGLLFLVGFAAALVMLGRRRRSR